MISKKTDRPAGKAGGGPKASHKKHEDIPRPSLGQFARHEWAFLGAPCGTIKTLANQLIEALASRWKIAYVDADHHADEAPGLAKDSQPPLAHGAALDYTDKISFQRIDLAEKPQGPFQFRPLFNGMDAVLVNGNHFTAQKQVVIVDPKKEDSLRRKLDRLTDVVLVLLTDGVQGLPDFLQAHLAGLNQQGLPPVLPLADRHSIHAFFEKSLADTLPPLQGLVLAGGKSRRMGTDKSVLAYHDRPQRDVMLDLVAGFCQQTFLSCRPDQAGELVFSHDVLPDTFLGLGPMGAILSAFRQQPDSAWLVVACDLPLLDEAAIRHLVENRDPSAIATAYRSPVNEFPEPLVAIWEPKSYATLLQFLAQGFSCPRKALINSPVHLIDAPNPDVLLNVNTPEDVDIALKKLGLA